MRVPFKGGGDAVNSMLTGTTPIAAFGIGNLIQFIRDGKIVGLAVDGDKRSPLAPDIPTFREHGYTEHLMATFFGIYAPMGTPAPIIDKLNKAIVKIASNPEFQKKHMVGRGLCAGAEHAGRVRQGAGERPRRGPRGDQGFGPLSEREVKMNAAWRHPGGSVAQNGNGPPRGRPVGRLAGRAQITSS